MRPTKPSSASRRFLCCVVLVAAMIFTLLSPRASSAQEQSLTEAAAEADVQFRLGNEAFNDKNFTQALSHYFTSNRLAPNRNLLLNIAICYERQGQFVEAYRYYDAYEQGSNNPAEKKALDEAKAKLRPKIGLVHIESDPPGATIYIDRKDLGSYGETPRALAFKPGTVKVILERPGYETFISEEKNLSAGKKITFSQPLTRVLGELKLSGQPPGARFVISDPAGVIEGTLPATVSLTPGERSIQLSAEGYVEQKIEVVIRPREESVISAELQHEVGSLIVQADEENAQITVDGELSGFTPAVLDGLSVGTHEVSLELKGFRPYTRTVTVLSDQRVLIDAEFEVAEDVAAASRGSETMRDAPASVSLISRREIEAFSYVHGADALQGTRGTYVSDEAGYLSLGVRGFSPFGQYGNRLQLQIDGHSVNESWIGSSFIGFDLMPHLYDIEQIEVIRGPSSVLYGTNAFFGVVNFVTPYRSLPQHNVRAGVTATGDGSIRPHASASAALGEDGGVWISGGGVVGQGQALSSFVRSEATTQDLEDINGYKGGGFLGRVWWKELSLHWYFNQTDKVYNDGSYETILGDDRGRLFDRRAYAEVRYDAKLTDWLTLPVRVYYDHYSYIGGFPYETADGGLNSETNNADWVGTELRAEFTPLKETRVDLGVEYQYHIQNKTVGTSEEEDEPYISEDHPYQSFSAYLTGDSQIASWFRTSLGVRFDGWLITDLPNADLTARSDEFFYSVNPRAAFIFLPSAKDTLKLMGGRAFRAASIYELTYNDNGFTQIASPGLTPETIYTVELEYTRKLPKDFWVTVTTFGNMIVDRIEQAGDGEDIPLSFANQNNTVWTLGGEVEVRRTFRRGWMASLQYSLQHTRLDDPFGDQELSNAPVHSGAVKVIAPIYERYLRLASRVSVESARLRVDGGSVPPVVLWDLVLSGETKGVNLRYSLGLRNLLDWRHDQPAGEEFIDTVRRRPGRSVMADLSFVY